MYYILSTKANCPEQNVINLTSILPTPYIIDWCTHKQDLDNFVNKLGFQYVNSTPSEDNTTSSNDNNSEKLEIPPNKSKNAVIFV